MWPFRPKPEVWTNESLDGIASSVRHFALRDGKAVETPRFQQKIDDYKKMLRGTPVVEDELLEMAEAFAKCFDRRSPMIRLLDDPAWRESLKVAETPRKGCRQCGDEIERDGRCPVCQPTIEDIIEAARMSNRGRQT